MGVVAITDGMASVLGGGHRLQSWKREGSGSNNQGAQRVPQLLKRGNGCRTEELRREEWFYILVVYSLRYRETGQGRAGQGRPTDHMMCRFWQDQGSVRYRTRQVTI
jgi:hypothetical protein